MSDKVPPTTHHTHRIAISDCVAPGLRTDDWCPVCEAWPRSTIPTNGDKRTRTCYTCRKSWPDHGDHTPDYLPEQAVVTVLVGEDGISVTACPVGVTVEITETADGYRHTSRYDHIGRLD